MRKSITSLVQASSALVVLVLAFSLRMAEFQKNTWQDEIRSIYSVVSAIQIRDVLRNISAQMQPAFEYLIRKLFWQPLLGQEERAARLVSLIYGLLAVWFAFSVVMKMAEKSRIPREALMFAATVSALVFAFARPAISYSVDMHDYSFIMMLSVLWFANYCLFDGFGSRRFQLLSLAFACTHFFSFFLIGAAVAYEISKMVLARKFRETWKPAAFLFLVVLITVTINRYSFVPLLRFGSSDPLHPLGHVLSESVGLFMRFWQGDLQAAWLMFSTALCLVASLYLRRERLFRPVFLVFVLFAFIVLTRLKSSYPLYDRYLFVFWGLAPVVLYYAVESAWLLAEAFSRNLHRKGAGALLCIGLLSTIPFGKVAQAWDKMRDGSAFQMPPRNFTALFLQYRQIKLEEVPVLILYSDPFTFEIPNYYMKHIAAPFENGFLALDTQGGNGRTTEQDHKRIAQWLSNNPKGTVFLHPQNNPCEAIQGNPTQAKIELLSINKTHCLWRVSEVADLPSLIAVVKATKFQASKEFLAL